MQASRRPQGGTGGARGNVCSWARICLVVLATATIAVGGCATTGKSSSQTGGGVAKRARVKLAVLPVEGEAQHARIAAQLNEQLRDVKVAGVDDYFVSKVALEVIQLSIECVEQTVECYAAVGKSLAANHLLFGTIVGGTRKRDKSVKIVLSLFDVASASFTRTAERQFKNGDEAMRGTGELVSRLSVEPAGGGARTAAAVEAGR